MSSQQRNGVHVEDEEGDVDRQTKSQVLQLRDQVDDDERKLYVDMAADPEKQVTVHQCNEWWGISVRQYLRAIKRLWSQDESSRVDGVDTYWKDMEIGSVTLVPPDQQNRPFSQVAQHEKFSESELRRMLNLPRGVNVPKPRTEKFHGLQSVLKTSRVAETWTVTIDNRGPPPEHTTISLQSSMPVPKHVLENAVEAADEFLQQAGIGFEIGVPDYYGGAEPGI